MKKSYESPTLYITIVSENDIMAGSDTDIDVGNLFGDEE